MESKSNKSRVEKYPLPGNVEGILSLMREIIEQGSVQRIELDVSLPVRVVRTAETGDPMMEEVDIGLKGVLRQADFVEYYSEGASPFQIVVDMMQLLHTESKHPTCWATGPESLLSDWMEWRERGMPDGGDHLLGLPVRQVDDLPGDVLILCGSEYPSAEADEITMAIKTAIEFGEKDERDSDREDDDPGRISTRERRPAASQLALAAGGLRRVDWQPPDQSGEGMG